MASYIFLSFKKTVMNRKYFKTKEIFLPRGVETILLSAFLFYKIMIEN